MPTTTSLLRRHPGAFAVAAGLAGLIALAVSGCASNAPNAPSEPAATVDPTVPIAEPVAEIDCRTEGTWMLPDALATADPSIPVPGRVPDGFEPAAALRCTPLVPGAEGFEASAPADDPEPSAVVVRVERFEGDLGPLITALAEPDDPVPTDQMCTADLELVAPLWLEDADGQLIPVHYPRDACGKTKAAVHDALAGLEVTSVSEVTISAG
jgi:hypothetical protein